MNIAEALRKQIELKGVDSLNDRILSKGILLDLTLNQFMDVRRFAFLYDIGAVKEYLKADHEPFNEKRRVIAQTALQLQQVIGLTPENAEVISGYFPEALGWNGFQKVPLDEASFPDPSFRAFITKNYDQGNKGYLDGDDLSKVVYMDVSVQDIHDTLKGIEYFFNLEILDCSSNDLYELDLSANTNLKELYCSYNERLCRLNTSGCEALDRIDSEHCAITPVTEDICLGSIDIDETAFPDEAFRNYISKMYDPDQDGKLSDDDIQKITYMDVSVQNIADLKGIEYFYNLEILDCSSNDLNSLDLNRNRQLKELYCSFNARLKRINVSGCAGLIKADIEGCAIHAGCFGKNVKFVNYTH